MSLHYPVFVGQAPDAGGHLNREDDEQEEEELEKQNNATCQSHVVTPNNVKNVTNVCLRSVVDRLWWNGRG